MFSRESFLNIIHTAVLSSLLLVPTQNWYMRKILKNTHMYIHKIVPKLNNSLTYLGTQDTHI